MFLYETHLHTAEASDCASATGAEQADQFKKLGYDGIFITDHFFNGNSHINVIAPYEAWEKKINLFYEGYENAKRRGDKIGLKVFFGLEFNYRSTEFLTYGITKETLIDHPEIINMEPVEYCNFVHQHGGLVIHAHPYREAPYIDTFRLVPEYVDGVEIYNAKNTKRANDLAKITAQAYDIAGICGSDCHHLDDDKLCAVACETEINSFEDFSRALTQRDLEIKILKE
ncbi:MAG: histidinol-phosphatase [Clostridiales bacterium]|nr:histidinol-phosphatase [Clostridiales bacterium]